MAWLDPSLVLLDPFFVSCFDVLTRTEVVNASGRSIVTSSRSAGVRGVVTAAQPSDLVRLDDQERGQRAIKVYTRHRLNGPTPGAQPDVLVWQSNNYVVRTIEPYANFGPGWVRVIAVNMDALEAPVP
jgi:hypothetical protein